MDTEALFAQYELSPITVGQISRVPISGRYGGCVSLFSPDELDMRAWDYAKSLASQPSDAPLLAADLGASPYCPQSIRFALQGFQVDAFDIERHAPQLEQINTELPGNIHYHQTDIRRLDASQLKPYSLIYSNRCLFFMPFAEAKAVLQQFIHAAKPGARFFISLMDMNGRLAINYPDIDKPLAERFAPVNNEYSDVVEVNMPVCFYYADEVESELLHDLPVHTLELIQTSPRSIKVVFEKT